MSDEIPVQKPPGEQKSKTEGQKPVEVEAYGGRVKIVSNDKLVAITFTTLNSPTVVSLPVKAFQDLLRDGDKALMEKGLGGRSIGKRR